MELNCEASSFLQKENQFIWFTKCQNTEGVLNLFLTKLPFFFVL